MDQAHLVPRMQLPALLFKAAMPRLAKALAAAGQPPPRAEEKERLFARLEEACQDLPDEVFQGWEDPAWEERAPTLPPVRALLETAVADLVAARPKPP